MRRCADSLVIGESAEDVLCAAAHASTTPDFSIQPFPALHSLHPAGPAPRLLLPPSTTQQAPALVVRRSETYSPLQRAYVGASRDLSSLSWHEAPGAVLPGLVKLFRAASVRNSPASRRLWVPLRARQLELWSLGPLGLGLCSVSTIFLVTAAPPCQ